MKVAEARGIDPALGTLSGEGAQQQIARREEAPQPHPEVPNSYYGLPMLKTPVWKAYIPAYFYVGGAAGGSAVLAAASLLRRDDLPGLIRAGRWLALGGAVLSGGLLIADLGRPSRFLYMLRVFRPTSPMNLGTWILSGFGAAATAALFPGRLGDAAGIAAGILGLPLCAYTAVLLSNTAVPLWQEVRGALPAMFVASAAASAGSLAELLPLGEAEQGVARRLSVLGKAAELLAAAAVERGAARKVERVAWPLTRSPLWKAGKAFMLASLAVSLLPRKPRWLRVCGGVLGSLGALAGRFAVVQAGKESARDPRASFELQRA